MEKTFEDLVNQCLSCKNPTCISGCPASNNIKDFIIAAKNNDLEQAYKIISATSTLPSICSLVCPSYKQCMGHCIKNKMNNPVNIPAIENYIANNVKIDVPAITKNNKNVAIIGSGPSGLACAEKLANLGYNVTIYDRFSVPGGILTYGIPEFVLPKNVVNDKVIYLKKLGVVFKMNEELSKDFTLESLKEKYDAIYLAFGASIGKKMGIDGENLNNVIDANSFLMDMYLKTFDKTNIKDIIVVGGGNSAIDAAIVAKKDIENSNVTIVYRRSKAEMPARIDEIAKAENNNIKFHFLANPICFKGNKNVEEIECIQMELVSNGNDRPRPVPINNSNFIIKADLVILALSSSIDTNLTSLLDCTSWGGIIVNENMQTSNSKIFAGGDCVSGPSLVVTAMVDGIKAANGIDKFLNNQ